MKTQYLRSFFMIILMLTVATGYGQKTEKFKKIGIKTSAQCEMCEERIIGNLTLEKGIKDLKLDLKTIILTVEYNAEKTTPEKIRTAISKIGYDADDIPADPVAYEKLPPCCKKDGHDPK